MPPIALEAVAAAATAFASAAKYRNYK